MPCYTVAELRQYLASETTDKMSEAIRNHLAQCESCRSTSENLAHAGSSSADALPEVSGYRMIRYLGEGSYGRVYLVRDASILDRHVALKVLHRPLSTDKDRKRFETEGRALALIDHEDVARIYECGVVSGDRPYLAIEYIPGVPLDRYADESNASLDRRLELFARVCRAVHHVHQTLLHRDIKPENLLAWFADGRDRVKVIDFGVAKGVSRSLVEESLASSSNWPVGTPEYTAPELVRPRPAPASPASDVYALGVVLYELLTGSLPIPSRAIRREAALPDANAILDTQIPRPSRRFAAQARQDRSVAEAIARHRDTNAATLQRRIARDLDWVTLKALEKDPYHRYANALELAEDIERVLAGEPAGASRPGIGRRFKSAVRRHRKPLVSAAVALLLTAAGIRIFQQESQITESQLEKQRMQVSEQIDLAIAPEFLNPGAVREFLEEAIAGDPTFAKPRVHLAMLELRTGNKDRAVEVAIEALALIPDDPTLAAILHYFGPETLRPPLKEDESGVMAFIQALACKKSATGHREALRNLARAIELNSHELRYHAHKLFCAMELVADWETAEEAGATPGTPLQIAEEAVTALRATPEWRAHPLPGLLRGALHVAKARAGIGDVIEHLELAYREYSSFLSAVKDAKLRVTGLANRARVATDIFRRDPDRERAGRYAGLAIEDCREIRRLDQGNEFAVDLEPELLYQSKRFEEALETGNGILAAGTDSPRLRMSLALAAYALANYAAAYEHADALTRLAEPGSELLYRAWPIKVAVGLRSFLPTWVASPTPDSTGELRSLREASERWRSLARESGDRSGESTALLFEASLTRYLGEWEASRALWEEFPDIATLARPLRGPWVDMYQLGQAYAKLYDWLSGGLLNEPEEGLWKEAWDAFESRFADGVDSDFEVGIPLALLARAVGKEDRAREILGEVLERSSRVAETTRREGDLLSIDAVELLVRSLVSENRSESLDAQEPRCLGWLALNYAVRGHSSESKVLAERALKEADPLDFEFELAFHLRKLL